MNMLKQAVPESSSPFFFLSDSGSNLIKEKSSPCGSITRYEFSDGAAALSFRAARQHIFEWAIHKENLDRAQAILDDERLPFDAAFCPSNALPEFVGMEEVSS